MSSEHVEKVLAGPPFDGDNAEARSVTRRVKRPVLRGILQVAVGVGALALVLARSEPRELLSALERTRMAYLPFAVVATVSVTWLMALRWGLILRVRGHQVRTSRLFTYYLIGIFFSNCVPGGGLSLDVARLIYADKEVRDKPFIVSTLAYERVVGLFAVLTTGLIATLASRSYLPDTRRVFAIEAALIIAFLASASLMSERVSRLFVRLSETVGTRFGLQHVSSIAARVLNGMTEMRRHKRMIVKTIALSFLIRVVWTLGCFIVAVAMGLEVGIVLIFAFISIYDLIRMLPLTINGLGFREWALVALFANVGVDREQALMFSFLAFAPIMLNAMIGGLIYISGAAKSKSMKQHFH